ncbi:ABC transporter substrate-binding protein [Anaerosporomusa subterranea]|uniref:ABC transporter substrate-binding protein n=1 Tax=Anaerosporomusa subterranea TaxID=1794912 RepID=A0A154BUC0_ANASB|nr:ABC transporter substrate-binding protein [Anaerosporomusa subterranea]
MVRQKRIGVILACVVLLLLTGCSTDNKTKETPAKQPVAQKGGKIVYGSLYEPATLNPLSSDMVSAHEVASLIFSGLVYMNDKGEWQPDLASDVPTLQNGGVSSDGRIVTYRLRNNVQWHDGKPFSAEDVIFTWRLIMNPRNNVISRDGYDQIASIEAPDKTTLVVRFREYYPSFLNLFSRILPKHLLEGADFAKAPFNRAPIGTGPFQFVEWRMAEEINLKANPNYHLGKPVLDTISYKIIPDINILLTQIKAGSVDIIGNLDPSLVEQARAIDAFHVVMNPTMVWEHIDLNLDNARLQDARVRQAISLAIDRQAIIAEAYRSAATAAAADQWPVSWAARSDLTPLARNVEAAKELLNQAGWRQGVDGIFAKDGVRLSLSLITTSNNKQRETATRLLSQQLREAGVELTPRFIEIPALFTDVLPGRRFESALYAWYLGPDPDNSSLWHSRNIPGPSNAYKGKNYSGWRNAEVDRLLDQAARTVEADSRKQIYYRIQELYAQEVPAIPLYFHSNIGIVKKTVLNYRPNASPAGNLWNAWQWAHAAK